MKRLPEDATLLATSGVTRVQAAEIPHGDSVFLGVQYHSELSLDDIAGAMCRQARGFVEQGFAKGEGSMEAYAGMIEAPHREPSRRDLDWQLGLDQQVTDPALRQADLRNLSSSTLSYPSVAAEAAPVRRLTASRNSASETAFSDAAISDIAG